MLKTRDIFYRQDAVWMCCANFGEGTGPILLDDVGCLGTEYDIEHCAHRGWGMHNCMHREDVSIRCSPTGIDMDNNIQIEILSSKDLIIDEVIFKVM